MKKNSDSANRAKISQIKEILAGQGEDAGATAAMLAAIDPQWLQLLKQEESTSAAPVPPPQPQAERKVWRPAAEEKKGGRPVGSGKKIPGGGEKTAPKKEAEEPAYLQVQVGAGIITRLRKGVDPDLADRFRDGNCSGHSACLNETAARNWPSFSCQNCPLFEKR